MQKQNRQRTFRGVSPIGKQKGSVIGITLLMVAALSLSSLMVADLALEDSAMMRNSREYRTGLYRAETGISLAGESHRQTWLAADSDLFDEIAEDAAWVEEGFAVTDKQGSALLDMGRYQIARIEANPAGDSLSENFYTLNHRAPVHSGAGFSAKNFEIRRYGIISTGFVHGRDPGVTIEAGLSKIFNRY